MSGGLKHPRNIMVSTLANARAGDRNYYRNREDAKQLKLPVKLSCNDNSANLAVSSSSSLFEPDSSCRWVKKREVFTHYIHIKHMHVYNT